MSELLAAAKEICDWLDSQGFRACIIGGLAVQRWGEPRLTRDVDLTVTAEIGNEESIVDACLARFSPRIRDARDFALRPSLRAQMGSVKDELIRLTEEQAARSHRRAWRESHRGHI